MTGFDASWLALREPLDLAARDPLLLRRAAGLLAPLAEPAVVDLGCGTGSTGRALGPLLPHGQRWRLVDRDAALLADARRRLPASVAVCIDLDDVEALPLHGAHLVTASALLDLASDAWLARLAERLAGDAVPLYAALTYDGQVAWTPAHRLDHVLCAALNAHQQTDKGLGPALGPDATRRMAEHLAGHGYTVSVAESPWRAGPADAILQRRVADVMATAAAELDALDAAAIAEWRTFRHAVADTGRLVVGHQDLLADARGLAKSAGIV